MHIAAYYDAINIFIYLVEELGVKILQGNAKSYNPLHYACLHNSIEVATYILAKEPDAPKQSTHTEFQYIYFAVNGNAPEILELLVRCGANPSSPENLKGDPIRIAFHRKQIDLLVILLRNYKPNNAPRDMTPIMCAIAYDFKDTIPFLIESGCKADEMAAGKNALYCACFEANPDVNVVRMLCNASSNVYKQKDTDGESAIHWICRTSDPEIVRTAVNYNINVNEVDNKGKYGIDYLNVCKPKEALEILEFLCQHGFNLNNTNQKRKAPAYTTFLHWPSQPIEIIAWVIKHGANIDTDPFVKNKTVKDFILSSVKISEELKKLGVNITA